MSWLYAELAFAADASRSSRPVLLRARLCQPQTPELVTGGGGARGSRAGCRSESRSLAGQALSASLASAAAAVLVQRRRHATFRTVRAAGSRNGKSSRETSDGKDGDESSRRDEWADEDWEDDDGVAFAMDMDEDDEDDLLPPEDFDMPVYGAPGGTRLASELSQGRSSQEEDGAGDLDDEDFEDEDGWGDEDDDEYDFGNAIPDEDDEEWDGGDQYDMAGLGYSNETPSSSRVPGIDDLPVGYSVFDGMDDPVEAMYDDGRSTEIPSADELSLLYDDFPAKKPKEPKVPQPQETLQAPKPDDGLVKARKGKKLEDLEEREYEVAAEGVAVRALPDHRSPRTGDILRQGERFTAIEAVDGQDENDRRLYLRLPDGKGWVFDDAAVYPGFPSVKLVTLGGKPLPEEEGPPPIKRPCVAIIGRPNVGKSTLANRICEVSDRYGGITFDSMKGSTTRDRTYKSAEHTDDCGDTFVFDVVDTGGMIFFDDPDKTSFKEEIRLQIDIALRESVGAIFVVDSMTGMTSDDLEIAKYLKKVYIPLGLRVVVAVAKSDRLEMMDYNAAEFWALGLEEPIPCSAFHSRGVWEVLDRMINGGCNGLFPQKIRGEKQVFIEGDAVNIAICGKPNAGKSSLLNAFIGEDRAIVSDIPGTTTDSIDAYLETASGQTYRFIDTSGIRKRKRMDPGTEWLAANRAMKAVKRAEVTLLVLDASQIMNGDRRLGNKYWCPDTVMRYLARMIEEKGSACVVVLSKWDAVVNKDAKSQASFIQAVRSNLAGVGQWAEIVTCSAKTGQRLSKVIEAIDKTLAAHRKRVPTNVLNEVVRDCLLWRLPPAKAFNKKQGRIYYATQVAAEPPQIVLFCNDPKLFSVNYKIYLENKLRQDLAWFGTPIQLEYRKRTERRALSDAEKWLGPRLKAAQEMPVR